MGAPTFDQLETGFELTLDPEQIARWIAPGPPDRELWVRCLEWQTSIPVRVSPGQLREAGRRKHATPRRAVETTLAPTAPPTSSKKRKGTR